MKIPYSWIQEEFGKATPTVEEITQAFIAKCFEVEGVEESHGDTIIDVKVLPDRAHYALSWNGLAYEISAIFNIPRIDRQHSLPQATLQAPEIDIESDPQSLRRYTACCINGIQNGSSPEWLSSRLESIGQRSINLIVDLANYVMFETGQPLHAFDSQKLVSNICVRNAINGEKFTTLDSKELELNSSMLVISDTKKPLALAGVKGGITAEVTPDTTSIMLESANFDPIKTRRTSEKVGIRNDSSKRFENNISEEKTLDGIKAFVSYLTKILHGTKISVSQLYDYYPQKTIAQSTIISLPKINSILGKEVSIDEVVSYLTSLKCEVEILNQNDIKVSPPVWRHDLSIIEDYAEEIGRLSGYDTLPVRVPQKESEPHINQNYFVIEHIKSILAHNGWTETILYTLGKKGDFETAYPVAKDKAFLRTSLIPNLSTSAEMNFRNADILEIDTLKQFEIGKVFPHDGEKIYIGLACAYVKNIKGQNPSQDIEQIITEIEQKTGIKSGNPKIVSLGKIFITEFEIKVQDYSLPKNTSFDTIPLPRGHITQYKNFSVFPYAVRDIAVFVPEKVQYDEVQSIIDAHKGEYCVKVRLFDVFTKKMDDGHIKTSYAFRLVFQSMTATLTEDEIMRPVHNIYEALKEQGWEIR